MGLPRPIVPKRDPGLSPASIYADAILAGFDKATAVTMTAIGLAESSGNNRAHNGNASTGDDSYGVWQINMLGAMGPARRQLFGIKDNSELYDPMVNAKAAHAIYQQQGLAAWSTYQGSHPSYLDHLAEAQAAAQTVGDSAQSYAVSGGSLPQVVANGVAGAAKDAAGAAAGALGGLLGGVRPIVIEAAFVVAGLGLVVAGVIKATGTGPALKSAAVGAGKAAALA